MTDRVLEAILKEGKNHDYFIVERHDTWENHTGRHTDKSIVLAGFPESILSIIRTRTIDDITYKEVQKIEGACCDANIFIYPSTPPFQRGLNLFRHAIDIMFLESVDIPFLTNLAVNTVFEIQRILEERASQEVAKSE